MMTLDGLEALVTQIFFAITVHRGGLMWRWDLLTLFWELLRHSSVILTPRK